MQIYRELYCSGRFGGAMNINMAFPGEFRPVLHNSRICIAPRYSPPWKPYFRRRINEVIPKQLCVFPEELPSLSFQHPTLHTHAPSTTDIAPDYTRPGQTPREDRIAHVVDDWKGKEGGNIIFRHVIFCRRIRHAFFRCVFEIKFFCGEEKCIDTSTVRAKNNC